MLGQRCAFSPWWPQHGATRPKRQLPPCTSPGTEGAIRVVFSGWQACGQRVGRKDLLGRARRRRAADPQPIHIHPCLAVLVADLKYVPVADRNAVLVYHNQPNGEGPFFCRRTSAIVSTSANIHIGAETTGLNPAAGAADPEKPVVPPSAGWLTAELPGPL